MTTLSDGADFDLEAFLASNFLRSRLLTLAAQMDLEPSAIEDSISIIHGSVEVNTSRTNARTYTITPPSNRTAPTAKSKRAMNLSINRLKAGTFAGGALGASYSAITNPNPILIAAAIIYIICGFYQTAELELNEREASVFWGAIQASGSKYTSTESRIVQYTNMERERVGLTSLSPSEVRESLHELKKYRAIKESRRQVDSWEIIEKLNIQ